MLCISEGFKDSGYKNTLIHCQFQRVSFSRDFILLRHHSTIKLEKK